MSKPLIELIKCDSGDWMVLKLNSEIYYEGHSIPDYIWLEVIEELGNSISLTHISDEDMEMGNY